MVFSFLIYTVSTVAVAYSHARSARIILDPSSLQVMGTAARPQSQGEPAWMGWRGTFSSDESVAVDLPNIP